MFLCLGSITGSGICCRRNLDFVGGGFFYFLGLQL
jgi:hypothetical protein